MRKSPPRKLEASIQKAVVAWCRMHENALYHDIYHIPNEGMVTIGEARERKRLGILKGVPDLALPLPDGLTLRIELKTMKGKLSKDQKALHARWAALGHVVYTAHGYDEAIAILQAAGEGFYNE